MTEKGISINISKKLGELLVSSGLITAAQLTEALDLQKAGGGKLPASAILFISRPPAAKEIYEA